MIRAYDEYGNIIEDYEKRIYNKAIDDFCNLAKEHDFSYRKQNITNCVIGFIEFFAKQLKEDVNNADSN